MKASRMRTEGNFELPLRKSEKPKFCKHCGRPVRETVGNTGYCKKCIEEARKEVKVRKPLYLLDLESFIRASRRIRRLNPLWALTTPQKRNVYHTCQEALDAIEKVRKEVKDA